MSLAASCPRCAAPVSGADDTFACRDHGPTEPLWRPETMDYDAFAAVVAKVDDLPLYLPWPMSPGWSISDVGCVGRDRVRATTTTVVGTSDLDGEVEVTVVSEEPGVGLGARCAAAAYDDPGPQISAGPPSVHVRAGSRTVPLWLVEPDGPAHGSVQGSAAHGSVPGPDEGPLVRAVFAGEADGRWLWLVTRPASAALLLHDDWLLADVTGFGPEALAMPFGGRRPTW